jgi:GT2 family glycosyltransferase
LQDKVSIVVLNYNGWRDTAACLSSLERLSYDNKEVVVVDNGSSDDSVLHIRRDFSSVKLIEAGANLGFAGGCNLGIRYALSRGAQFVWLLNNDTEVAAGALSALVDRAKNDERIGAVGSAIYFMDRPDRMQAWGGGSINFRLGRSRHFLRPVGDDQIEFITGASMLISRAAIESIGFLDEGFFMYWEDADFCFRLRHANWRLAVADQSKVWHRASSSVGAGSARMDLYFNASAFRFFQKHAVAPMVPIFVGGTLRLFKRIVKGEWERTRAVWAGITQGPRDPDWTAHTASPVPTSGSLNLKIKDGR